MKRFRPSLFGVQALSYASVEDPPGHILDLGEGDNPYGFNPALLKELDLANSALWTGYPHTQPRLKKDLIRWWKDVCPLSDAQIHLTAGSIDAIYKIHALFDPDRGSVLGVAPQFSEAAAHARAAGFALRALPLLKEERFRIPIRRLEAAMTDAVSFLHLEHPHNPTGQTIAGEDLKKLLLKAQENGSYVVVDEAYGDYLPREASAAVLLDEFENLLVIRSFSKGFGLAGARAGYLLASKKLQAPLALLTNPFVIPGPVGDLLHRLLQEDHYIKNARERIAGTKKRLRAQLGDTIHMAETEDTVPICLLYVRASENLAAVFQKEGIRVVSGENYPALDASCVRIRMPREEDEERLFRALARINEMKALSRF